MISNCIRIGYDKDLLDRNIKYPLGWYPDKQPHILIAGATGSGKTYLSKLLLAKIAMYMIGDGVELYLLDYKNDKDFHFLFPNKRFYSWKGCTIGLQDTYKRLEARMSGEETKRNPIILFIDEYASMINGIRDKKEQEMCKNMISDILMMGRSFNFHLIIAQQRADAKYFDTARDNFSLRIGLGTLSPESARMLFPDHVEQVLQPQCRGEGFITDSIELHNFVVPHINDMFALEQAIDAIVK